jgi:hypothetical protein
MKKLHGYSIFLKGDIVSGRGGIARDLKRSDQLLVRVKSEYQEDVSTSRRYRSWYEAHEV